MYQNQLEIMMNWKAGHSRWNGKQRDFNVMMIIQPEPSSTNIIVIIRTGTLNYSYPNQAGGRDGSTSYERAKGVSGKHKNMRLIIPHL